MAVAYAVTTIEEMKQYRKELNIKDVIENLSIEAENLQEFWFYAYLTSNGPRTMDRIDHVHCTLGKEMSPIKNRRSGYTCRRGDLRCDIVSFLSGDFVTKIFSEHALGGLKLGNKSLRTGIEEAAKFVGEKEKKAGVSAGQKICFPIGDCVLVCKAKIHNNSLATADRDQLILSNYIDVACYFYDHSLGIVDP